MISAFIGAYTETAETMRRIERSEERARAESDRTVLWRLRTKMIVRWQ